MSRQLVSRNSDLSRLREMGYDLDVIDNFLVIRDVPYVDSSRVIRRGILVSELTLAGDLTVRPSTHVINFIGQHPCHADGAKLTQIAHSSGHIPLTGDLIADHSFSAKPPGGYEDYYHKITTYEAIISGPAESLDPSATAKTFKAVEYAEDESVFVYLDTGLGRGQINVAAKKLELDNLAIVGLGGTGSYVLDLVAKTLVKHIHLFDSDGLLSHNAFRSPGAATLDELRAQPKKVDYLAAKYSKMRRGIIPHSYDVNETTVDELACMEFVFLCLDHGPSKRIIVDRLNTLGTPFIDVGMGLFVEGQTLDGTLRLTTSTPEHREHVAANVSFAEADEDQAYDRNIQISELNALNAALAVIRWKKLLGFYFDVSHEYNSCYSIGSNIIVNDENVA
jgi:uncharacterized protein DUF6791/ThiF family protein